MFAKYKLPTDHEIIKMIYEMYAIEYPKVPEGEVRGVNDPYVPIDIDEIANRLKSQPELIFGRLYFHLNQKYNNKIDGVGVDLFVLSVKDKNFSIIKKKAIQFPLLTSILAAMDEERSKFINSINISLLAILISLISLVKSFG